MATFTLLEKKGNVLVAGFEGYGAQLNQNVFAKVTRDLGVTDEHLVELDRKVHRLAPHFVRIFFDPRALDQSDLMQSFKRTVELAQSAASTINITWTGGGEKNPDPPMKAFAGVLADLVENHGAKKLRWVTIGNEPNRTKIELKVYEAQYRSLRVHLNEHGLHRNQIGLMGGDLVQVRQAAWCDHLAHHMSDVLDAWSIHVYWTYDQVATAGKPTKLVKRLNDVVKISKDLEKNAQKRKPLFVTEYGVRGTWKVPRQVTQPDGTVKTKQEIVRSEPGIYEPSQGPMKGRRVVDLNINAFQHAWFNLFAANLGYHGLSKWDAHFGKYDLKPQKHPQEYGMIGRPKGSGGWPLRPSYHLTRLFTQTVRPRWDIRKLKADQPSGSQIVAAYSGPSGELTLIGLDTAGANLVTKVAEQRSYNLCKLPPNRSFELVYWNRGGGGKLVSAGHVRTDGHGNLTVEAPLHSVFAVTTVPVDV